MIIIVILLIILVVLVAVLVVYFGVYGAIISPADRNYLSCLNKCRKAAQEKAAKEDPAERREEKDWRNSPEYLACVKECLKKRDSPIARQERT